MKKKLLSALLCGAMAASLLAGCGGSDEEEGSEGGSAYTEVEPGSWDGETSHVVMTYLTLGTTPTDLEMVQDAINEITIPDIGVEVELYPVAIFDTFSQYPTLIAGGTQIDLMMVAFSNLNTYSDQGMIEPLDELLEGTYIQEQVDAGYPLYDGTYYNGEVYGVSPLAYYYGTGGSVIIPTEYYTAAGLDLNGDTVYTLDDLTDIYAKLKAAYPDCYPSDAIVSGGTTATRAGYYGLIFDNLGATASSGVLMGTDSTTIVNLFATDEYKDYLEHCKEWYDAGYIYPDAATTSDSAQTLIANGVILTETMTNQPVMLSDFESGTGFDSDQYNLSVSYYASASSSSGTYWTVPITAADPEASIRLLDYTFSNHDLCNLILWGIEGTHFEVLDADNYLIGFPEGIDGTTSGYYNTLGLYGDRRYEYVWNAANSKEVNAAYTEEAMANPTKAVGYAFDTTNYGTQIANIDTVVGQYLAELETGSAADFDAEYAAFLQALDDAGINDVIAANQEQFDAWLAEQ